MMQIIPKWKVVVEFVNGTITIFISDNHVSNVMRQFATMSFENEPERVTVSLERQIGT